MTTRSISTIVLLFLTLAGNARSFQPAAGTPLPSSIAMDFKEFILADSQDDPAYTSYKAGYNDILDERWDDARKKFAEMLKKYPKSDFVDDAEYWSAFALRHADRVKAISAYKKFVEKYPKSTYYDDAVADLNELKSGLMVITPKGATAVVEVDDDGAYRYVYTDDEDSASAIQMTEHQMRSLERDMRRQALSLARIAPIPRLTSVSAGHLFSHGEKYDPDTQLKLDALNALGDEREDERSFQILKEVALDFKAAHVLRMSAINILSDFKKFDAMPVFVEIAKKDTNEEMQAHALNFLSDDRRNNKKTAQTLIEVYNSLPKQNKEQRRRVFFTIADIGGDAAIDFLASVARTSDEYEMRREAVFYLGNIGSDKARTVLYDILRGKTTSK